MKSEIFFKESDKIFKASSPGRLDVMGGIADYSGSLVLQMPINELTTATIQPNETGLVEIRTLNTNKTFEEFAFKLNDIANFTYLQTREYISKQPNGSWALYVIGCILISIREKKALIKGAKILIDSKVPVGKGVSSSAALEVSTLIALSEAYNIKYSGNELPILAQMVENLIVGAPCGLMDQLSSYLGQKNKLLPIICQPDDVKEVISIPKNTKFYGIDSSIRHAVSGASYGDVRTAAFMGYTIIAHEEGVTKAELKKVLDGQVSKQTLPYNGFLANITPSVYLQKYSKLLPDTITGREFKSIFQLSIDPITSIEDQKVYNIKTCTEHPINENFRVNSFLFHLSNFGKSDSNKELCLKLMGELMYQSHASYSACGLGNEYTNMLVEMARKAGYQNGIFGAKITGGGSGGTVCFLTSGKEGEKSVKEIAKKYSDKISQKVVVFSGSTNGGKYQK